MTETPSLTDVLVRSIPDAIIVADREGRIVLWNGGAERIFGYAEDDALNQSLDLIIPERLRQRHWDGYNRVMGGAPSKYGEGDMLAVPAVRADGSTISIEFTVAIVEKDGERLIGAVIRDVTERWQRERELRKQLAEAGQPQ
ncbi:MAG TPA: PAS domain S-box protein [Dehalococcoidia bacterium]|nr:PAS domain S-box protein [Dehalococcoidia bacterium]